MRWHDAMGRIACLKQRGRTRGGGGAPETGVQTHTTIHAAHHLLLYDHRLARSACLDNEKGPLKQQLTALGPDSDAHGGGDGAASSTSSAGL